MTWCGEGEGKKEGEREGVEEEEGKGGREGDILPIGLWEPVLESCELTVTMDKAEYRIFFPQDSLPGTIA